MGDEIKVGMDKIVAIDKILNCRNGNLGTSRNAELFLLEKNFDTGQLFEMFYQSTGYVRFQVMNMILERISIDELDSEQLDWFIYVHAKGIEELECRSDFYDYFVDRFVFNKRMQDMKVILKNRCFQEYGSKNIKEYHPIFLKRISVSNPEYPTSDFLKSVLLCLHSSKIFDEFEKISGEYLVSETEKEKRDLISKAMNLKKIIIQDSIEEEYLAEFLFKCEDEFVIEEAEKIYIRC